MNSPPPPKGLKRHRFRNAIKHGLDAILPSSGSRSASPNPAVSTNSKEWVGLETALRVLETSANTFPPLKSAVGGLLGCLDIIQAAATNHEDYQELASELTAMAGILNQYMTRLDSEDPGGSVARIARSIGNEVECINQKQGRNKGRRLIESIQDKEDVIKRYRRIEGLFRQLQSEVSLHAWETTDKQFKASLLRDLLPVDDALYNSSYSTTIKRRGCTAETREKVQADLQDWVRDPDAAKVYWMNGMAGTGKTTIAYSLCEWLEENQLLGASFFCSRVSSSCRNVNQIIPTIAYQLAQYSPAFRSSLCRALEEKMNAGKLNVVWQFKRLVEAPLQKAKDTMPEGVVVVIDALDECEDVHGVRLVLETLLKLAADLPLKFFVASRPEPTVRDKMLSPAGQLPSMLHLHDIEQSIVEGDINKYLTEALSSMCPPPSVEEIGQLAKHAGKLFIYAATAVRYILPDAVQVNSHARLQAMLTINSRPFNEDGAGKKYRELDALYSGILAIVLDPKYLETKEMEIMQLVLRTAVCAQEPMTPGTLAHLLGLAEQEVTSALRSLRSVLHVSEAGGLVSTLHASFPDFMFDRARSMDFYCDRIKHNELLVHRCFHVMKEQLRFNICHLGSSGVFDKDVPDMEERIKNYLSPALFYACRFWGGHLQTSDVSEQLSDLLDYFISHKLLFWMEVLNLKRCMLMGADILLHAQAWLSRIGAPAKAQKQVADAQAFTARFAAGVCTRSTPHIYISALPFCPRSSSVYTNYWVRTQGLLQVNGTAISRREKTALATWMIDSEVRVTIFSPNGAYIISGTSDGAIRVWDALTSDLVAGPLKGHTDAVLSASYSPDGTRIVSASGDCTIRVWDANTGSIISRPFEGHAGGILSVAFSPDGTRIVSGSSDRSLRLWDAQTGDSVMEPLEGHSNTVRSVAFSPDGSSIASGSDDKTIRIWDARNGGVVSRLLEGHTHKVYSVAFSPDGTRIVSGSGDCTVRVWDLRTGSIGAGPFNEHDDTVCSVAFSPDGTRIVSGSYDRTIQVRDIHAGSVLTRRLEGHTDSVMSVAFSPDSTHIVSGSLDCTIRRWDARLNYNVAGVFQGHKNTVHSVSFSPNGAQVVSCSSDWTIRVWDAYTGEPLTEPFREHTDVVWSVAFSPDGNYIVSGSGDCTIRVWDARTGETAVGPLYGHLDSVYSVSFSPDSTRIVSGSGDGTIRLWNARTGDTAIAPLQGHTNLVKSVAFSPDGTRIVSGSCDFTIRIWDSRTGEVIAGPFEGHVDKVYSVAFSPDGTHVASGSRDYTVRVWDAQVGAANSRLFTGHTGAVRSVAFSPDGSFLVSGSDDRTLRLWDVHTGDIVAKPFQGHADLVFPVAFSPDGTRIISGSCDYAIRVWNVHPGDTTQPRQRYTNLVQSNALFPSSSYLRSPLDQNLDNALSLVSTSRNLDSTKRTRIIHDALIGLGNFTFQNDGWVTTDGVPLLWIPPDFREHLPYPQNTLVIGHQGSAYIDYRNLVIGEQWSECYLFH